MSSQAKFVELLAAAAAVYNTKPISKQGIEMYWRLMARFTVEQLQAAMMRHMETSEFFPKPAELIRIIEGTAEDQSLDAWLSVMRAIKKLGSNGSPQFHDEIIPIAIEALGGWQTICRHPEKDTHFWQKRFADAYIMAKRQGVFTAIAAPTMKAIEAG